jgi:F-type H+-transporting ATPase subunit c
MKLLNALVVLLASSSLFAQETVAVASTTGITDVGIKAIAAAIAIGITGFGAASGQGRVGAAALDGIARNPAAANKISQSLILALALIESIAIFAVLVIFTKI